VLSFRKKSQDIVTLVVESTDLRYLCVRQGKIHKWGSVDIPPGLVSEGTITNAVEMGNILEGVFQREALDPNAVRCAVSGLRSIPRLLTLPKLQASLLDEAVTREARKEMPVSLDDLYLSKSIMASQGEMQRVYLLGVPRDVIDSHIRSFEAAALKARQMDLKPLAVIRAVNTPDAVIVNLEQSTLDIILVVGFMPAIMRCFSLDSQELDQRSRLERMLNEMNETVRFYNESHLSAPIRADTPAFLTGRELGDLELLDYLQPIIDRPCGVLQSPFPPVEGLKLTDYATNIGLAMKKAK